MNCIPSQQTVWLPLQKRTSKDKVSGDLHIGIRCIDLEEKALKKDRQQQAILGQNEHPQPVINTPSSIDPTLESLPKHPTKVPSLPIEPSEETPTDPDIEDVVIEGRGVRGKW